MTSKFLQPGEVIDYTATADVASGDVVVIGARIGVALTAIKSGATGSVQVSQVFALAKKGADVIAQGAPVYWDATNKYITTTESTNNAAGYAFHAAAAGVTTVAVKLNA